MFSVKLIASSFLDLISKQAGPECCCKRVLVLYKKVLKVFCTDGSRHVPFIHKTVVVIIKITLVLLYTFYTNL